MNVMGQNARGAIALTKSDVAPTHEMLVALYVAGTGDVCVVTRKTFEKAQQDGTAFASMATVIFQDVPAGTELHVNVYALKETGTSATDIIGYLQ